MNKTTPFSVRLPPELRTRLDSRAAAEGVTPATLNRRWIEKELGDTRTPDERLRELLARAVAIVIASLSDKYDLADADRIVAAHLLRPEETRP